MGEPTDDAEWAKRIDEVKVELPEADAAVYQARNDESQFRALVVHQNQQILAAIKTNTKAIALLVKAIKEQGSTSRLQEPPKIPDPPGEPALFDQAGMERSLVQTAVE